jgi:DNA-binding LytR/AlgR family response regulator
MKNAINSVIIKAERGGCQLKIAICDDDSVELGKAKKVTDEFILSKQPEHKITVDAFTSPSDMLAYINKHGDYDLLILDILMPGMNGIELAHEIRSNNSSCKIIFLSSSPEFAINSYKVSAFYYMLKPFSDSELISLLDKALGEMAEEKSNSIVIKEKNKLTRVQIHTIQHVEVVKHSILFHLRNDEVLCCYGTLTEFQNILLSDRDFIQCHRSFIINMNYVASISNKYFILDDKTLIPISKLIYQQVKNAYIDYFFDKGNDSI